MAQSRSHMHTFTGPKVGTVSILGAMGEEQLLINLEPMSESSTSII